MEEILVGLSSDNQILSLRDISTTKVAGMLWNNQELLRLIMNCRFPKHLENRLRAKEGEPWKSVQAKTNQIISSLDICETLKKRITDLLWPASHRILLWKSRYASIIDDGVLPYFYWTNRGKIDNIKTAGYLIASKDIPVKKRFSLASKMCLWGEMIQMRQEMTEDDESYFRNGNEEGNNPIIKLFFSLLDNVWFATNDPEIIVSENTKKALVCATKSVFSEMHKFLFPLLSSNFKTLLVEYCFYQLAYKGSKKFLEEDEAELSFFLLSLMDRETQKEIADNYPMVAFSLLLRSSKREHFLQLLGESTIYTNPEEVDHLIHFAFYMYHVDAARDYDYRQLFIDMWRLLPSSAKNYETYESNLGPNCLCLTIKENFNFLLEKGAGKIVAGLTPPGFQPSSIVENSDFNQPKWNFLLFIIKEGVVSIPTLEGKKTLCFKLFRLRPSQSVWNRLLKFVRTIENRS